MLTQVGRCEEGKMYATGASKAKNVIKIVKIQTEAEGGRVDVISLSNGNKLSLKPDYQVEDKPLTQEQADGVLSKNRLHVLVKTANEEADQLKTKQAQDRADRKAKEPVVEAAPKEPKQKKEAKIKAARPPRIVGENGEGKCAFIDRMIQESKHTADQIVALAQIQFKVPDADLPKLKNTVQVRPSHLKAAGWTVEKVDGILKATK